MPPFRPGIQKNHEHPPPPPYPIIYVALRKTAAQIFVRMDYAKKSLSLLSPQSLSKCILAVAPPSPPRPRPFRVTNHERSVRKGMVAESLRDLQEKVRHAWALSGEVHLVLEEDGTSVEMEEFFQTLEEGAVLMALAKGQEWRPEKAPGYQLALSQKPRHRIDVARLTFDLYKTNPRDLIGCLNIKTTLYGTYSMSYDMQCYGAKRMMREALRWALFTMQATGHVLLGTSCYVKQLLDATEEEKAEKEVALLGLSLRKMLL
ncbi:lipid transferase CIDEC isoform X2 [Anolis carolinensis]|uniref:lipid transferase CIDEC isoform X2 n=1 Tax=Anolis carolinensis TaxID=28377 RepID=UPI002F2B772D